MKKVVKVFSMFVLVFVLIGCGKKAVTDTFTQSPMEGTEVSIIVKHEGDKVTEVSAKATFDNKKLGIVNKAAADQVAKSFEASSGLKDTKIDYTEKETVLTAKAPKDIVKTGSSFKKGEKNLINNGFKKK